MCLARGGTSAAAGCGGPASGDPARPPWSVAPKDTARITAGPAMGTPRPPE
jgi:hypothetical protein